MVSLAKGVSLSLGLISATVRVESALDKPDSLRTLCVGTNGPMGTHSPLAIRNVTTCDVCGPITDKTTLLKGKPVGDGFAIVDADAIETLKHDHDDAYKKSISLTVHPVDEVASSTAQGEKMYYLVPDGAEDRYALFASMVEAHPELAFVGLYTVRSRASMFTLRSHDGILVLEERTRAENMKAAPEVTGTCNQALLGMAEQLLPAMVTPYDAAAYSDTYQAALDSLLAAAQVTEAGQAVLPIAAPKKDADADLLAALAAMLPVKEA